MTPDRARRREKIQAAARELTRELVGDPDKNKNAEAYGLVLAAMYDLAGWLDEVD